MMKSRKQTRQGRILMAAFLLAVATTGLSEIASALPRPEIDPIVDPRYNDNDDPVVNDDPVPNSDPVDSVETPPAPRLLGYNHEIFENVTTYILLVEVRQGSYLYDLHDTDLIIEQGPTADGPWTTFMDSPMADENIYDYFYYNPIYFPYIPPQAQPCFRARTFHFSGQYSSWTTYCNDSPPAITHVSPLYLPIGRAMVGYYDHVLDDDQVLAILDGDYANPIEEPTTPGHTGWTQFTLTNLEAGTHCLVLKQVDVPPRPANFPPWNDHWWGWDPEIVPSYSEEVCFEVPYGRTQ